VEQAAAAEVAAEQVVAAEAAAEAQEAQEEEAERAEPSKRGAAAVTKAERHRVAAQELEATLKVTITPPERQPAALFPVVIGMNEACMFEEHARLFGDDDHAAEDWGRVWLLAPAVARGLIGQELTVPALDKAAVRTGLVQLVLPGPHSAVLMTSAADPTLHLKAWAGSGVRKHAFRPPLPTVDELADNVLANGGLHRSEAAKPAAGLFAAQKSHRPRVAQGTQLNVEQHFGYRHHAPAAGREFLFASDGARHTPLPAD
jgi:hypothetical protein